MHNHNFRSIGFWKETMMTLPDNSFFELLRTVFGKIKTPFNKQVLMGDLEKFLLRDDIKKNVAGYIDQDDARIIAAVAALNEPTLAELETFFSGELNPAELRDMVINLEERFIIYRFVEKENDQKPHGRKSDRNTNGQQSAQRPSHLALNPVFKSILSPFIADKTLLYPSISVNEIPQDEIAQDTKFLFDDRILAALLSFVSRNSEFFRVGGVIRQKVDKAANALFPGLREAGLSFETLIGGLQVLGLFFAETDTLVPDYQRFAVFGGLARHERLVYCAAGILCYTDFKKDTASKESANSASFSTWLFRSKVHNYAEIINRLHNSLDPHRLYPHITLQKMAYNPEFGEKINDTIIIMEKIGLLVPASNAYWRKVLSEESTPPRGGAVIAMDTPFTILVYPEIAYNDVVRLASFSNIIDADMTVRFELNRDSAVSAFNRGISAGTIIELLKRLSHNRISENVSFTLNDWEKRHGEVTLRKGLVLTLAPEQRHLAATRPLSKLIAETLAPGVYLLPESEEEKVLQALDKAGVAIIARRGECQAKDTMPDNEEPSALLRSFFPPLYTDDIQTEESNHKSPIHFSAPILIESFRSILDKMRLGREEREELSARIDRRLVLCEAQLKDAVVRYERLEARGLDYAGKAMIAKQAIAMQSPVEVIWPGKQKRVVGLVKALEKAGSETILVISVDNDDIRIPGDVRIPLGKISVLRRIKKSIFEGG